MFRSRHIYGIKRIDAGFTLLELLLAVAIFSIIAVSLYSTLNAGLKVLKLSQDAMIFNQNLRLATEGLSLDLRNALPAPLYEEKEEGSVSETEAMENKEEPVYFFLGEEKKFSFVTLRGDKLCDVTYYFDQGTGSLKRVTKYQGSGFAQKPGGEEVLLKTIEDIKAEYSYAGMDEDSDPEWKNAWRIEETVPLGVKVKIKFKNFPRMKEYTKTVLIPVGKLGAEEEGEL